LEYNGIIIFGISIKGALLAPLSILASALIGGTIALWAILSNRQLARQKNSMDFINSYNEGADIAKAQAEVKKLDKNTTASMQDLITEEKLNSETVQHIRNVLNYYEVMAICINRKIYDDEIIKETLYSTVTQVWNICEPFITELRIKKSRETAYQELELMVKSWKNSPLSVKKK
jgi:hypothetical protein